ncbi:hypothetical protein JL722_8105 [Aureococcus anophagefferens]|nr:hypothetical protein JL722_8105 [Aureococcus anophagefferens]
MTSVAARAATQDELAFLSEFLEPTTGDDSSEESDAELDCSAPAPRSPPPRGGGVAMRQVTRAELRYVLDDAAAPEPERAWSGEAEELSDGDDGASDSPTLDEAEELSDDDDGGGDGPALAASCCRLAAPRRWLAAASTTERINLTLGAGDYVASGAAAAVDAFLAPRVDWAVEREPWAARRARFARADTAAGAVYRDLATLWRDAQWSGGCGRAQSLGATTPGAPSSTFGRNAWAAWSGATFVPPSLRGWYLAAPADDAFCAGAASQWACHFLPLSACDEIAESGEDDDARFVRVFSRGNVTVCRGGCDDAALRAAGLAGPPDPRLAAIFAGARGAVGAAPHDLVGALLQRGVALRPSYRVRHLARPPAVEGPCVFAQIRHGSKTSPQWLAAQDGVVLRRRRSGSTSRRGASPTRPASAAATDEREGAAEAEPREGAAASAALARPARVAGPLFSPLNATEICAVKEVRKRPGIPGCEKGGPFSAYRGPSSRRATPTARPVVGDDRWLARALSEARRNASRVFRVLVVGGSPAAGEGCVDAPVVSPRYAYAKAPKTHGSSSECSWASRLARYLEALLLPRGNFRIANVARGGASSAYFLAGADALFRRPADLLPEGTSTPPLANDRVSRTPENLTRADFSERRRALARAVAAPLVESMFWNGGTFRDEAEQRKAAAFLNAYLAPALRVALDSMMGPASWKGFGHYGAAYHEWVAATVFYALVAPAAAREHGAAEAEAAPAAAPAAAAPRACGGGGDALALCRLGNEGAASSLVFDAGPNRGALVGSPDGWLHGEDVPGKSGWVTCDGGGSVSFRVECAAGDVVVGFLQSHDRRMGVANVTVAQGAAARSFWPDAALRWAAAFAACASLGPGASATSNRGRAAELAGLALFPGARPPARRSSRRGASGPAGRGPATSRSSRPRPRRRRDLSSSGQVGPRGGRRAHVLADRADRVAGRDAFPAPAEADAATAALSASAVLERRRAAGR